MIKFKLDRKHQISIILVLIIFTIALSAFLAYIVNKEARDIEVAETTATDKGGDDASPLTVGGDGAGKDDGDKGGDDASPLTVGGDGAGKDDGGKAEGATQIATSGATNASGGASCGDFICNGSESCSSCSGDCGTCPTTGGNNVGSGSGISFGQDGADGGVIYAGCYQPCDIDNNNCAPGLACGFFPGQGDLCFNEAAPNDPTCAGAGGIGGNASGGTAPTTAQCGESCLGGLSCGTGQTCDVSTGTCKYLGCVGYPSVCDSTGCTAVPQECGVECAFDVNCNSGVCEGSNVVSATDPCLLSGTCILGQCGGSTCVAGTTSQAGTGPTAGNAGENSTTGTGSTTTQAGTTSGTATASATAQASGTATSTTNLPSTSILDDATTYLLYGSLFVLAGLAVYRFALAKRLGSFLAVKINDKYNENLADNLGEELYEDEEKFK